jgi:hypothetical protein
MADPQGGRLDPSQWPGMDADAHELQISKDDAKSVIKALDDDLKRYNTTTGSVDDLKGKGHITDARIYAGGADDTSGYPAGRKLAEYLSAANQHVPDNYQKFLESYQRLIQAFGEQVGVYEKADDQNVANAQNAVTGNTPDWGTPDV